jgi:hypothetical protein
MKEGVSELVVSGRVSFASGVDPNQTIRLRRELSTARTDAAITLNPSVTERERNASTKETLKQPVSNSPKSMACTAVIQQISVGDFGY